jgi:hypothetical protein
MQKHTSETVSQQFNSIANIALLTEHARKRMDQRGVKEDAIKLALQFGRKIYSRRALFLVIGHKEINKYGGQYPELKALEGLQVVVDVESHKVLTAYRSHDLRQIRPKKRKHCHLH